MGPRFILLPPLAKGHSLENRKRASESGLYAQRTRVKIFIFKFIHRGGEKERAKGSAEKLPALSPRRK